MATYKVTEKLTAGVYDMQFIDHWKALGPMRYSKDWTINAHYDFSPFLYVKAEQHIIQGNGLNYDQTKNPNGLKTDSQLTVLKIGVSF